MCRAENEHHRLLEQPLKCHLLKEQPGVQAPAEDRVFAESHIVAVEGRRAPERTWEPAGAAGAKG